MSRRDIIETIEGIENITGALSQTGYLYRSPEVEAVVELIHRSGDNAYKFAEKIMNIADGQDKEDLKLAFYKTIQNYIETNASGINFKGLCRGVLAAAKKQYPEEFSNKCIIEANTFDKTCQKAIEKTAQINIQQERANIKVNNDLSI